MTDAWAIDTASSRSPSICPMTSRLMLAREEADLTRFYSFASTRSTSNGGRGCPLLTSTTGTTLAKEGVVGDNSGLSRG